MKDLVKGFMKWLIIVLATLCLVVWGYIIANAQHIHDDITDLEDDIRIKSVFFLNVDKNTVYFRRETKYRVDLGSFDFDSNTIWDRAKPTSGCMVAIYCTTHDYLYAFYPCKK